MSNPVPSHWSTRTHRALGLSSLLFLILISVSGLILNHADALGMSRHAAPSWLLSIYGVELPPIDSAFVAGGVLFATSAQTLYADGRELAKSAEGLIGAVAFDGGFVVATSIELFLASSDLALIERFAPDTIGPMKKLGIEDRRIIVAMQQGYAEFDSRRMLLAAPENIALQNISWSKPATPDDKQVAQIGAAALGQAIHWERVLLDLHSGRILPGIGRYLADITAACLLYMCMSGIILWFRRR